MPKVPATLLEDVPQTILDALERYNHLRAQAEEAKKAATDLLSTSGIRCISKEGKKILASFNTDRDRNSYDKEALEEAAYAAGFDLKPFVKVIRVKGYWRINKGIWK